jgi:CRP-like cAMP-binding protein
MKVPVSQRTLAGMIGASREKVNRAMKRLVETGEVAYAGSRLIVRDPTRLRRLAEGVIARAG